uniref:SpaH/EbpB family LPXTG-anchored major pilin n=1 Tax=Faecousia sp. TaxID=2952921 RepID=UPI004028E70F
MKNKFMKVVSLCLALVLCFGSAVSVSAAEVGDAVIDETQKGSLTIYKYDLTGSEEDGVWDSSYVSTGVADQDGVNEVMKNYALKGVEFSYLKIADIVQHTGETNRVEALYALDQVKSADFLKALGLENGAQRYTGGDALDGAKYYYQSDVLISALSAALTTNSTVAKNALERYAAANGAAAMPLTDTYGKTKAENLDLGLYLIVETGVPENVVSTTDPFLISLPMTAVNGTNAADGGTRWIYDVTVYPKNQTGEPTLVKTLRESKANTGKNNGSSTITDGFAHTGTASGGDTVEYQILSTLPAITSESTYLTSYSFVDTLSQGLTYTKGDVVMEFFTDSGCTDSVAKWLEADGKFTVSYAASESGEAMTITMTKTGLEEINSAKTVYTEADMVNSGYSDQTLRITYTAKLDSDDSVVYGDDSNPNQVTLTWKRTSADSVGTLKDDCHLYTYGIDLTKKFSDSKGDFSKVEFVLHNDTDNYFVQAKLDESDGIYYVTAHVADEKDATHFIPVTSGSTPGKVIVKGLEDDTYRITEVRTDSGYTLLKENIQVVISQAESETLCGNHHLLTASAKVDGNAVTMLVDNGSANAEALLTVVNTRGFDLPETGDNGTMMFTVAGILLMAGAAAMIFLSLRRKQH